MSGLLIQIESAALDAALGRAIAQLDDPQPLYAAIGDKLRENIEGRFDSKTDPDGAPWAALLPSTVKKYAREDKGARQGSLLIRHNNMRQSLTFSADADGVELGFAVPYAQWHEEGTRHMARRGLLGSARANQLGATDEADVLAVIDRFLIDLL